MCPNDTNLHHRRSIRLRGYDYTQAGAYFVTICSWKRLLLFGEVVADEMHLNDFGEIIVQSWEKIPEHFENVDLDVIIVMPNHVHGIIVIKDSVGEQHAAPLREDIPHVKPGSLGAIMRSFKSAATRYINQMRNSAGQPDWQRNYYDRVIRNEQELNRIRHYIESNPILWDRDEENPVHNVGG